jgi:hypothetical protein
VCENCGVPLPDGEEEERPLSFVQGLEITPSSLGEKFDKIPLEESRHLKLLKETVKGVQEGELTLEDYRKNVKRVADIARELSEVYDEKVLAIHLEKVPEEARNLVLETGALHQELYRACTLMLQYDGGENLSTPLEGLKAVEEAFLKMDSLQDRLVEKAGAIQEEIAQEEEQ